MNIARTLMRYILALACLASPASQAIAQNATRVSMRLPAAGVNLAGGEFGEAPGKAEKDFHFPADSEFAWAKKSGFSIVRLPFLWERLQPALEKDFDAEHLALLAGAVDRARKNGLTLILDVHNYGRWRGETVGGDKVPDRAFADLWRRLAQKFGKEAHVVFGLMNEPHDMPAEPWAKSAQAAIDAIRAAGACNLVLVPGVNWTGAHSWAKEDKNGVNAQAMRAIHDEGAHAFEFHQYLDADSSGTSGQCRKKEEVVVATFRRYDMVARDEAEGLSRGIRRGRQFAMSRRARRHARAHGRQCRCVDGLGLLGRRRLVAEGLCAVDRAEGRCRQAADEGAGQMDRRRAACRLPRAEEKVKPQCAASS